MTQVSTDVRSAIDQANSRFAAALARGDAAALGAMYSEDAQVLPDFADIIQGREAIQALWQSQLDAGLKGVDIDTLEVDALDDTAIEVARFTLYGPERTVLVRGKYLIVWKHVAGQWKIHRDAFSGTPQTQ